MLSLSFNLNLRLFNMVQRTYFEHKINAIKLCFVIKYNFRLFINNACRNFVTSDCTDLQMELFDSGLEIKIYMVRDTLLRLFKKQVESLHS